MTALISASWSLTRAPSGLDHLQAPVPVPCSCVRAARGMCADRLPTLPPSLLLFSMTTTVSRRLGRLRSSAHCAEVSLRAFLRWRPAGSQRPSAPPPLPGALGRVLGSGEMFAPHRGAVFCRPPFPSKHKSSTRNVSEEDPPHRRTLCLLFFEVRGAGFSCANVC